MGEISALVELENTADRNIASEGLRDRATIRRTQVTGVVDTGAVMLVLPENVVDRLGLERQRKVVVSYADERKESRAVAGPVTVHIGNRFMITECVVGPPLSEPLIGQIVLEALDLIADCTNRTVTPRPESPDYPLLKLKCCRARPDTSPSPSCRSVLGTRASRPPREDAGKMPAFPGGRTP